MLKKELKYTYQDVSIVPAEISTIDSRQECHIRYGNDLPIFTAPMDSIVNQDNINIWELNGITPILPRTLPIKIRKANMCNGKWVALSLKEFNDLLCEDGSELPSGSHFKALLDIANGHMKQIITLTLKARQKADKCGYSLEIMAGNIANPETYKDYCDAGIDYVRCGIGGGSMCITSSNSGVHYPLASLIDEIRKEKECRFGRFCTKIVADGGIRNYSDAIKALALGADYVMIGGIFSAFYESASRINEMTIDIFNNIRIDGELTPFRIQNLEIESNKRSLIQNYNLTKTSHGMSTKEAQKAISPQISSLKTSEGKTIVQNVKYTIQQWTENFEHYLRTAMSYTNKRTLEDFIGNVTLVLNSNNVIQTVNK